MVPSPSSAVSQPLVEEVPVVPVVERGDDARGNRCPTVSSRSSSGRQRVCVEVGEDARDRVEPLLGRVAEEAVALVDAVVDVRRQRPLEARGLAEAERHRVERDVDGAVEHEPADLVREQVGVGRSELGAVGGAEVVELRLAQRGAEHVHVAGRLDRRDVRRRCRRAAVGVGDAPGPEVVEAVDDLADLRVVVGHRVGLEERVHLLVGEAVDRRGLAGAARVEADDVEVVGQRLDRKTWPRLLGVRRAGGAGPARVDHQRADPLGRLVGGVPEHLELDGLGPPGSA